jgi:antirestriction protein ArdC
VRKGEKATLVVFWKFVNDSSESQDDGAESGRSRLLFTRGYSVFNAVQVDGYTPKVDADMSMPERIAHAEAFFGAIGADLRHGGNQAFYTPASDHIQMPPFGAFADNVAYYSTLAHEHTHWTATAARCDRQLGKRFGANAYAAEELIAELGAAFTCVARVCIVERVPRRVRLMRAGLVDLLEKNAQTQVEIRGAGFLVALVRRTSPKTGKVGCVCVSQLS